MSLYFVECDYNEVMSKRDLSYKVKGEQGININLILDFLDSGTECARVCGYSCASGGDETRSLAVTLRRMGVRNVAAMTIDKEPYLVRTDLICL